MTVQAQIPYSQREFITFLKLRFRETEDLRLNTSLSPVSESRSSVVSNCGTRLGKADSEVLLTRLVCGLVFKYTVCIRRFVHSTHGPAKLESKKMGFLQLKRYLVQLMEKMSFVPASQV